MEITEVKVFPVRDKKLRAFASIVLDASFMVNDIKVIQGKDGLFISMPSRRQKNGRFKDIAHPLNQETRQVLEDRILSEFRRLSEDAEGASEPGIQAAPRRRPEGRRDPAPGPAAPERPAVAENAAAAPRPAEPGSRPDAGAPARAAAAPAAAPAPPTAAAADALESPAPAVETSAAESATETADEDGEESAAAEEKSLEEVAEDHLSDSYWTT